MLKHIEYGDYTQQYWRSLEGPDDYMLIKYIDKLKELNWGDYKLFLHGGIVEGWETHDVDSTIIGPRDPQHINYLLDNITRIGFEMRIYPDVRWAESLFDWQEYKKNGLKVSIPSAHYRGDRTVNGVYQPDHAVLEDGLYMYTMTWPIAKTINKNHDYKSPVRFI